MTQQPSDLGDHTGYWLRMVSNAVSQDFARRLMGEGVTVAEWAFLRALYSGDAVSPSALAASMAMTRSAISKLADRLVDKKLVERAENPGDRRAHSLSLTRAGREKVPILAALADRNDSDYFGVLSSGDHQALRRILGTLVERRGLSRVPVD